MHTFALWMSAGQGQFCKRILNGGINRAVMRVCCAILCSFPSHSNELAVWLAGLFMAVAGMDLPALPSCPQAVDRGLPGAEWNKDDPRFLQATVWTAQAAALQAQALKSAPEGLYRCAQQAGHPVHKHVCEPLDHLEFVQDAQVQHLTKLTQCQCR